MADFGVFDEAQAARLSATNPVSRIRIDLSMVWFGRSLCRRLNGSGAAFTATQLGKTPLRLDMMTWRAEAIKLPLALPSAAIARQAVERQGNLRRRSRAMRKHKDVANCRCRASRFEAFSDALSAAHFVLSISYIRLQTLNSGVLHKSESQGMQQTVLTVLLVALFVLAPVFRSGQVALALLALELISIFVIATFLWRPPHDSLTKREWFVIVALIALPLVYLIPLPSMVGELLPGRELYRDSLTLLGLGSIPVTLSIVPVETERAILALLVPIAVFMGARVLDTDRIFSLVLLLIAIAAFEVVLGLMQYGGGKDSGLYLGMEFTHFGSAVGTYTNRNHLAGLIEMALPICVALLVYSMGRSRREPSANWRRRVSFFGSIQGNKALIYGALALLLLVGVIFTRSRAGIALTMLGILMLTFMFARRIGGDNVYGLAGTIVAVGLGIGLVIGLAPVFDRFAELDPMEDLRWTMFDATIDGIGAFFPFGSGPGTYAEVFHAFQPVELGRWFINYAHNDYLQWLFEGGLFAGALILAFFVLYLMQWGNVWKHGAWSRFRFVQGAAGIGIVLISLHELVDYNLQMPANMVYFAFLLAVFFREADDVAAPGRQRRTRRTPRLQEGEPMASSLARPSGPHPQQIPNPFLD